MKKYLSLLWLTPVLLHSCVEPDTTAPIISITDLNPALGSGLVCGEMEYNVIALTSIDTLLVGFRLTDNDELSQYKLEIHQNFDCHGHAGKVETTDWFVISIEDVSGADQHITNEIPVPTDVTTGTYHFSIQATDASGNSAESAIYSLNVTNVTDAESPVLSVTDPGTAPFSVEKGTSVHFAGTITDNFPLGSGSNGRLELRYWDADIQTVSIVYQDEFEAGVGAIHNFSFDAIVPITTPDGTYIFELRSFDAVNNPSNTVQFTVEVF